MGERDVRLTKGSRSGAREPRSAIRGQTVYSNMHSSPSLLLMRRIVLVWLVSLLPALWLDAAYSMGAGGGGAGGGGGAAGGGPGAGADRRDHHGSKLPTRSQTGKASGKQTRYGRQ